MATYTIASNGQQELICDTGRLDYIPDPVRHQYGVSARRPLEDWLLIELDFLKVRYPRHDIFTLGESCVFGEKFITYLTVCELDITPGSFEKLRHAVLESDRAIRRKLGTMWKWDMCVISEKRDHATLFIGWLDFAYFVHHRKDFLDTNHNRFMGGFAAGKPRSTDFKILHDGTIVEFDPSLLTGPERDVFEQPAEIRFEIQSAGKPETRTPLRMM